MDPRKLVIISAKTMATSNGKKWACDFCGTAAVFNSRDEALTHERECYARTVTTTFTYQYGKMLGIMFIQPSEDNDMRATVSDESPVFDSVGRVHEAANTLILPDYECDPYEHWENMDTPFLCNLISFGRKNGLVVSIPSGTTAGDSMLFGTHGINDGSLKATLTGKIRPGDILKTVEYRKRSSRKTHHLKGKLSDFNHALALLRCPDFYPISLTFQRRVTAKSTIRSDKKFLLSEWLHLNDKNFVRHAEWNRLSNGLSKLHLLRTLILDRNDIGQNGCVALGPLLRKKNSSLKRLSLRQNDLDNECISILVDALRDNDSLEELDLSLNYSITSVGWNHMLKLLCDETSIENTYLSNHVLKCVGVDIDTLARKNADVSKKFGNFLKLNAMSRTFAAQRKIMLTHFDGDSFDLQPLLDFDVNMMPHTLPWFMQKSDYFKTRRFHNLYHLIRNWNIPLLFGFPSAERMRIGSQVTDLEAKNADLEALVAKLKAENRSLREKVKSIDNKNIDVDNTSDYALLRRSKRRRRS